MVTKLKILIILLLFSGTIIAQRPEVILPGKTKTVHSQTDTLWVVNNKLFKKTIITKKQLNICKEQVETQKKLIETLKKETNEQKILIDTLKSDRDFYRKQWKDAEADVSKLLNMSNKYHKLFKIALIGGTITTVAAFIAGFLIGM